jgi:hypothetical protein
MDESSTGGPSLLGGVGLRKGMPGQQPGDGESVDDNALSSKYQALKVPQGRMADRPADAQRFREIEPFCVAASDLINPLPPSLFYGSGWKEYHPPKNALYEDRHYWWVLSFLLPLFLLPLFLLPLSLPPLRLLFPHPLPSCIFLPCAFSFHILFPLASSSPTLCFLLLSLSLKQE